MPLIHLLLEVIGLFDHLADLPFCGGAGLPSVSAQDSVQHVSCPDLCKVVVPCSFGLFMARAHDLIVQVRWKRKSMRKFDAVQNRPRYIDFEFELPTILLAKGNCFDILGAFEHQITRGFLTNLISIL